jgi:hypothetical protein
MEPSWKLFRQEPDARTITNPFEGEKGTMTVSAASSHRKVISSFPFGFFFGNSRKDFYIMSPRKSHFSL